MITGEVEAVDRKQKIRDRYKGVDISELEVIPAKIIEDLETSSVIRRVAAYIRVSTDNDEQTSSYELQKNYYTDYIQAQPGWVFVGIYADEGISGTSLEHRKGMQQLIEDCKAGKIDLVLTKSIARFARNIVDCLSVIELLKNLNPPVGVKFEADNIYTLDSNGRMILTILASVAEEESHSKSIIMNWSIDRRFSRGLFLTPALLGYDKDEEGNLVINPEEAQTVKVIYYLYLNGYSLTEIATLLMEYSRKTKLGRVEWNPGTLAGVLANERHCGDVLARKTFTPNFLTHNRKMKQIAVQACGAEESGAHRVGKPDESNSGEIKCMALVRMIYGDSGWDKKMSYRLIGRAFPQQRLVSFKITDAMQIENGRVLTEM